MIQQKSTNSSFNANLNKLGFDLEDDCLFLVADYLKDNLDPQIRFQLEKAKSFDATAVFFRKQIGDIYNPQAFLYDFATEHFGEEDKLIEIQKRIWSNGIVPLACIFYKTEISILDCTTHITKNNSPEYLVRDIQTSMRVNKLYNELFAIKLKSGLIWEEDDLKKRFKFGNSAYDKLIKNISFIIEKLSNKLPKVPKEILNKIIVQSILIKYLEERVDDEGNKLFSDKYFHTESNKFTEVLAKPGAIIVLLNRLNHDFNGNIFKWEEVELSILKVTDLSLLGALLETDSTLKTGQQELWRFFEFNYIPVELISRLYEEFLGRNKKQKGLYYTPAHLAKLLVDESMPLNIYHEIDCNDYKILDASCGSGIFLVFAFKRLVQWWRLNNKMQLPNIDTLKKLLKNVFGVDEEAQAVQLTSFSLCVALCDELKPFEIIHKLKFEDLRIDNLITSNFFVPHLLSHTKFNLVIGNPPFVRGGLKEKEDQFTDIKGIQTKVPFNQLALKFLTETLKNLKPNALQCLIVKATSLLYNSSSYEFKSLLFTHYNVVQILDFTALARNRALWENGADVATAAIFIKNEIPDESKNILHLTLRRTKAIKERLFFEIDEYDFHFLNRNTAINNELIWKINLLGGGRLKPLLDKIQDRKSFADYLYENNCDLQEGHGTLKGKVKDPTKLRFRLESENGIRDGVINQSNISQISVSEQMKIKERDIYYSPNIIISETLDFGNKRLSAALNNRDFIFKNRLVSIYSKDNNHSNLRKIYRNLKKNNKFYFFQLLVTSAQIFINKNTSVLAYDFKNIKYIEDTSEFSTFDNNIIDDVLIYIQQFLRNGENALALNRISGIKQVLTNYGDEFVRGLNLIYADKLKSFRLSDIIPLYNKSFIAAVFKFDELKQQPIVHPDLTTINLEELNTYRLSQHLNVSRIIKIYSRQNTLIIVKPNQYRYWISLTAYRDADKYLTDLLRAENDN